MYKYIISMTIIAQRRWGMEVYWNKVLYITEIKLVLILTRFF